MYVVKKNGITIAVVEADNVRMDNTGDNLVMVFIKGDKEATIEQNEGTGTPYVNWETVSGDNA